MSLCTNKKEHAWLPIWPSAVLPGYPHCRTVTPYITLISHHTITVIPTSAPVIFLTACRPSHCTGRRGHNMLAVGSTDTLYPFPISWRRHLTYYYIFNHTSIVFINNITCVYLDYIVLVKFYLFAVDPFSHCTACALGHSVSFYTDCTPHARMAPWIIV